jgi:hypothetical protein
MQQAEDRPAKSPEPTPAGKVAEDHTNAGVAKGADHIDAAGVAVETHDEGAGHTHPYVPWLDLGLTAAIGGLWWIAFMILLPWMSVPITAGSGEASHG